MVKESKIIMWLIAFMVVLLIGLSGLCLYQYGGLKQYIRTTNYINSLPTEKEKIEAKENLAVGSKYYSWGIYAGSFLNKIWIWNEKGINSFFVENNSVYKFIDGCSEDFLSAYDQGKPIGWDRKIFFQIEEWNKKVTAGDYVMITKTIEGKAGNIKEISAYNFLPFVQQPPRILCAK